MVGFIYAVTVTKIGPRCTSYHRPKMILRHPTSIQVIKIRIVGTVETSRTAKCTAVITPGPSSSPSRKEQLDYAILLGHKVL